MSVHPPIMFDSWQKTLYASILRDDVVSGPDDHEVVVRLRRCLRG